jgi:hypothetical protein
MTTVDAGDYFSFNISAGGFYPSQNFKVAVSNMHTAAQKYDPVGAVCAGQSRLTCAFAD